MLDSTCLDFPIENRDNNSESQLTNSSIPVLNFLGNDWPFCVEIKQTGRMFCTDSGWLMPSFVMHIVGRSRPWSKSSKTAKVYLQLAVDVFGLIFGSYHILQNSDRPACWFTKMQVHQATCKQELNYLCFTYQRQIVSDDDVFRLYYLG